MITASDLRGHWRRDWIKTPDRFDDTTRVHWLQGDGFYADIRVPLHRPQMDDATCLADLPSPVLADLMQAEGFAGDITVVDGVCTWARHINLHGLPAPVDAGAMWFQDDGALIEDGVHATYRERWHGVATPPLNALSVEVDGLRIITVWNAHVFLVASGPLRHAADPHLIDVLRAGTDDPATRAAGFAAQYTLGTWQDGVGMATLSTNPFAEGTPALRHASNGLIWTRTGFDGTRTDIPLPAPLQELSA